MDERWSRLETTSKKGDSRRRFSQLREFTIAVLGASKAIIRA